MTLKLIFISDLHLSPATPDKNQLFYRLLNEWRGSINALYILGDFFDYWVGDDDNNSFIQEMTLHLRQFSQVTPIYFRSGNHDFAVGNRFAKQSGMHLIPDLQCLELDGMRVLLSHGDIFCSLDVGYQKMKRYLQNPVLIFLLRRLPLSWRYALKSKIEQQSKNNTNCHPPQIYQVVESTMSELAAAAGAKLIIHGHTHNPGYYQWQGINQQLQRYELPDWEDNPPGGYLLYAHKQFHFMNATN